MPVAAGEQAVAGAEPQDIPTLHLVDGSETHRIDWPWTGGGREPVHRGVACFVVIRGDDRPGSVGLEDMKQAIQAEGAVAIGAEVA